MTFDDIFTERGIPPEIWERRPYTPWEKDEDDPIRAAYGGLGTAGLNFALKIAKQSPGYLINRFPPGGLGLDDIYPEFRPKNKVKASRSIWHVHVYTHTQGLTLDSEVEELVRPYVRASRLETIPWYVRTLSGQALEDHVKRGFGYTYDANGLIDGWEQTPKDPTDHLYPRDWGSTDWHKHQAWAKYVFPSSPRIDDLYTHDHRARWHDHEGHSDKWITAHVAKDHSDSDEAWYGQRHEHPRAPIDLNAQDREALIKAHAAMIHIAKLAPAGHGGIDIAGEHEHTRRDKDKSLNLACRLDVHPLAMEKIRRAEVVFFVIEGCLKSDSILAKGAAVFSVPSVSLWDCQGKTATGTEELRTFVAAYLKGKEVVIVPDADWADNKQVRSQARLCRATLNRYGVESVHIAAPPVDENGKPTRGKGVDDFLGEVGHGELSELQTIDFYLLEETKALIKRLVRRSTRIEQVHRNGDVLESLALFAGPTGVLPSSMGMVARAMGTSRQRVTDAVNQLEAWGALSTDRPLVERRGYWTGKLEWSNAPVIEIAEQYRAHEAKRLPLGDVAIGSLTTP